MMELRWDPILREWVMVSSSRSIRPWLPKDFCPFCPGAPETGYGWKVLVLENKYPMLSLNAPKPPPHSFYRRSSAVGRCLIIVETPEHELGDLSDLPADHIKLVLNTIRNLVVEESKKDYATYLLWFRNKGTEIGVSLTHPHSQIYITPFIPSKIRRELQSFKRHLKLAGRCLLCDIMSAEEAEGLRILYENAGWLAFTPFYSHWPFEATIAPRRHVQLLSDLTEGELEDLAEMLKTTLCGFKGLFKKSMPYMLILHQAPLKGVYKHYHLHIEIYGVERDEGKLKYVAGMEHGGGNFTYDGIPEENAEKLRKSILNCTSRRTTQE